MTEQRYKEVMRAYDKLMTEFGDVVLYGLKVDRSPQLEALCLICADRCSTPEEAAVIVAGFFADAWILNIDWKMALGEFAVGPTHTVDYGSEEVGIWAAATEVDKELSTLLEKRIGICLSYSFTLGIVLKVAGLAKKVFLASYKEEGVGHMLVLTEGPDAAIDLSRRAHFGNTSLPNNIAFYSQLEL